MNLLNTDELKKQIANGTFTGLDDITNEFKNWSGNLNQDTFFLIPKQPFHFVTLN